MRRLLILCGVDSDDAVEINGENARANRLFIETTGFDSIEDWRSG